MVFGTRNFDFLCSFYICFRWKTKIKVNLKVGRMKKGGIEKKTGMKWIRMYLQSEIISTCPASCQSKPTLLHTRVRSDVKKKIRFQIHEMKAKLLPDDSKWKKHQMCALNTHLYTRLARSIIKKKDVYILFGPFVLTPLLMQLVIIGVCVLVVVVAFFFCVIVRTSIWNSSFVVLQFIRPEFSMNFLWAQSKNGNCTREQRK